MSESDDLTFLIAGWDDSIKDSRVAPPWCRNLADAIIASDWLAEVRATARAEGRAEVAASVPVNP